MTAAVILLNWRNASDTLACIESVLASRYRDFQILVCDNASGDGSVERFRAWSAAHASVAALDAIGPGASCDAIRAALLHRVVWIETGGNLGFAGGNNVALKLALAHRLRRGEIAVGKNLFLERQTDIFHWHSR